MAIGQTYQSWIHIDAAWGGATMMLPENRQRYQLLHSADSISFDPHKALSQPKPSSVLLSRHGGQSLSAQVDYLSSSPDNRLPGSYGGELFLPLWLNLQMLGEDWFYQQIRQRLAQSRQFGLHLAGLTDWPVSVSETGIVCFEPQQPDLLATLPDQGIFSRASINGRPVYRAVFASANTQAASLIKVLHPYL
jgi:glutamate/tyrosine decarboxylase-like PLP-dependent enzyme